MDPKLDKNKEIDEGFEEAVRYLTPKEQKEIRYYFYYLTIRLGPVVDSYPSSGTLWCVIIIRLTTLIPRMIVAIKGLNILYNILKMVF